MKSNGSEAGQRLQARRRSSSPGESLVVGLSRASESYAEIAWRLEPRGDDEDPASRLSACELAYGPLEDPYQVEVMSNFVPRGPTFTVGGLRHNTTYHFHMVCYCCLLGPPSPAVSGNASAGTETKLTSNVLKFTTGAHVVGAGGEQPASFFRPPPPVAPSGGGEWRQRDPYQGSYHSVYKETILRDDEGSSRAVPSFNVLLGALTGIVGFLIINVTVVIAVRRCSHRRRRRILVLEERDNEDFPYLRPLD